MKECGLILNFTFCAALVPTLIMVKIRFACCPGSIEVGVVIAELDKETYAFTKLGNKMKDKIAKMMSFFI